MGYTTACVMTNHNGQWPVLLHKNFCRRTAHGVPCGTCHGTTYDKIHIGYSMDTSWNVSLNVHQYVLVLGTCHGTHHEVRPMCNTRYSSCNDIGRTTTWAVAYTLEHAVGRSTTDHGRPIGASVECPIGLVCGKPYSSPMESPIATQWHMP